MTRNLAGDSTIVGPVLQFSLLLVPLVINGFYMVYSLTGWILSGRDRLNWSLEAETVGIWVASATLIFCALVAAYTRWRGGRRWHPLMVSSAGHAVLVILLTVSILITTRL